MIVSSERDFRVAFEKTVNRELSKEGSALLIAGVILRERPPNAFQFGGGEGRNLLFLLF